ncbi:uncharacterized protein LOC131949068 [Physella acuta]|uniref:uncharacterized protein LOC131949068 n=1 Tax=Physella acuta TaxID=109671 RepID=UPI0027DCF2E9|nr:uncharacterized protein LOC131949068 [Physella acuta]
MKILVLMLLLGATYAFDNSSANSTTDDEWSPYLYLPYQIKEPPKAPKAPKTIKDYRRVFGKAITVILILWAIYKRATKHYYATEKALAKQQKEGKQTKEIKRLNEKLAKTTEKLRARDRVILNLAECLKKIVITRTSAEDLVTENEELRQKYEELVKEEENLQKQIKEQEKTISLLIAMLREKNKKAADSNTTEVGRKYADMASLWDTGIKNPGDQMKGNDLNHQPIGISPEGSGKDALEFD